MSSASEKAPGVCGRCGSIRVRILKERPFRRLVSRILRQDFLACGRCGWRGRVRRVRRDPMAPVTEPFVEVGAGDPIDLSAIDDALATQMKSRKPWPSA